MRKGRSEAKGGHVELALDLCGIIWKILGKLIQTPPSPLIQNYTRVPSCPALHQGTKCGDRAESAGPKEREREGRREKPSTTLAFWVNSPTFSAPGSPGACRLPPYPRPPWNCLFGGRGTTLSPHVLGTYNSAYTLAPTQIHKTSHTGTHHVPTHWQHAPTPTHSSH